MLKSLNQSSSLLSSFKALPSSRIALLVTAVAISLGATSAATSHVAQAAPTTVNVSQYGAKGDGVTDDSAAIQNALNAVTSGKVLVFTAGKTYAHSKVLRAPNAGVRITGAATLLATDYKNSSFSVEANNVTIDGGLYFKVVGSTARGSGFPQQGITIRDRSGTTLSNITVDNSAASGIMLYNASNYLLDHVTVKNAWSDCIHQTKGSNNGHLISTVSQNCGDDGVAVVSYKADGVRCHDITVDNPQFLGQTHGRAYSVVGGYNVTFNNIYAINSDSASLYFAAEGVNNFNTYGSDHVTVNGGTIINANKNAAVQHGAILIYNAQPDQVMSDITVKNLTIQDTRATAGWEAGMINTAGSGGINRIAFDTVTVTNGPTKQIYLNGVTTSAYNSTAWKYNGVLQPDNIGWVN